MEQTMTMLERVELGLVTTVVGLAIVLAVLAILWGVLELFRIFFYDAPRKKAAAEKEKAQQAAAVVKKAEPVVETASAPQEDEEEIIAVITAAIAASMETSAGNLKIKSFKRVDNSPMWNRVSRKEQLDNVL
ncbi:MAG: OadG family protein [Eubacteriales bacterium]|jgi:Na+-transporting methylmalonyl-CoA/oxaloacetate decarboxylase gamma subunit